MMLIKNIKKYFILYLIVFSFFGCENTDFEFDNIDDVILTNPVIDINTTRSAGNILRTAPLLRSSTSTASDDPFTEIREVECFESVVLPELQPHIWIGNIMTKSSIVDCNYSPLVYPRTTPITVSMTLPGTNSKIIDNPSYSKYLAYIQEQTGKGTFVQSNEFSFTTEQFTSYNELKVAFGSNVNTGGLFWGSSSSTSGTDHTISKATGLYVKFYQTSFKVVMDYPNGQIASIPTNQLGDAVYINSITYGRLGILTIETNTAVHTAQTIINSTFNKLFASGSSSLTTEERAFLNGCDFKVYLIGGNSSTAVETFSGYDGFVRHIKKGTFSRNEPGAPLFCTFNHVKDNSPVSVKFKYSIKKEPLYVELKYKTRQAPPVGGHGGTYQNYGDLYIYFYKNRSKIPTIAPPSLKFTIKKHISERNLRPGSALEEKDVYSNFQNAGYQTSMQIASGIYTQLRTSTYMSGRPDDRYIEYGDVTNCSFLLEEGNDFIIMGYNPLDGTNIQYAQP